MIRSIEEPVLGPGRRKYSWEIVSSSDLRLALRTQTFVDASRARVDAYTVVANHERLVYQIVASPDGQWASWWAVLDGAPVLVSSSKWRATAGYRAERACRVVARTIQSVRMFDEILDGEAR